MSVAEGGCSISDPPSKNRVWNFFPCFTFCTGEVSVQVVEVHRENTTTGEGIVLGRPNGNVSDLVDANHTIAAHYNYDPYGNVISSSGTEAGNNKFRFSTKYFDQETGLYNYVLRPTYHPSLGRFLSRDPAEEGGGLNLNGMCGNDGVNAVDYLGLNSLKTILRKMNFSPLESKKKFSSSLDVTIRISSSDTGLGSSPQFVTLSTEVEIERKESIRSQWNNGINSLGSNQGTHGGYPQASDWIYPNLLNAFDEALAGADKDGMKVSVDIGSGQFKRKEKTGTWRTTGTAYGSKDANRPSVGYPLTNKDAKSKIVVSSVTSDPLSFNVYRCPVKGEMGITVDDPGAEGYFNVSPVSVKLGWEIDGKWNISLTESAGGGTGK